MRPKAKFKPKSEIDLIADALDQPREAPAYTMTSFKKESNVSIEDMAKIVEDLHRSSNVDIDYLAGKQKSRSSADRLYARQREMEIEESTERMYKDYIVPRYGEGYKDIDIIPLPRDGSIKVAGNPVIRPKVVPNTPTPKPAPAPIQVEIVEEEAPKPVGEYGRKLIL